jgi:hypothetical protein
VYPVEFHPKLYMCMWCDVVVGRTTGDSVNLSSMLYTFDL